MLLILLLALLEMLIIVLLSILDFKVIIELLRREFPKSPRSKFGNILKPKCVDSACE